MNLEKQDLSSEENVRPRIPHGSPALWKCVAVAVLVSFALFNTSGNRLRTCLHHERLSGSLHYAGEHISWEPCGDINGRPLECSTIDVPMDQFDAQNSGNKTFSIPLVRQRGYNATQNLLLNPGGPGGSGSDFMSRRGESLRTIIGEGFHLLSFDPRGVNGSRPQATCYPNIETRRNRSTVRTSRVVEDSVEAYTWAQNFVRACADTLGEHGKYLNTPQTAADMNSILDAVGQDTMTYWGFSYGTLLGQTYATLFPNRSERVIIDGVVNQFDWYESRLDNEAMVDTEHVFEGFLDECIKAGDNCTLSSLASSKEELSSKLLKFANDLKEEPQSVYVNNTVYGMLEYENVLYDAVFPALYKPATWYELANRLAKMLEGNATEALLAYGLGQPWDRAGETQQFISFNDGLSGSSSFPQDRESLLKILIPFMELSPFAATENGNYYIRQQWLIPRTHDYVPRKGVETAHPLLILSTTYDPICPLVSAQSANDAFEGSQIVEVQGYGHCSIAVSSMCLAKHVRAFLYNGTLPDGYTKCEVDGPYFIKPEENGNVVATKYFDDPDEQQIHLAQIQLAREWEW